LAHWTDSNGNFWFYGANILPLNAPSQQWNDLWEFSPSTQEWTWVGGSSTGPTSGTYGTLGAPSTANYPDDSSVAGFWTDMSGNFWLLDGIEMWEFNPSTQEWTWMGGQNTPSFEYGEYGTLGTPAAGNHPGTRSGGMTWTDGAGNFWLFGGLGYASNANSFQGELNDFWEYDHSTHEWTWIGGSNSVSPTCDVGSCASPGVDGALGTPAAGNIPGGRYLAASWIDTNGNLWMFGGREADRAGNDYNDLWEFNPSTSEWTMLLDGPPTASITPGVYGSLGQPAPGNHPGSRDSAATWIDSNGNLWLFGGFVAEYSTSISVNYNDVWELNPSTVEWTWVGGSGSLTCTGTFGCSVPISYGSLGFPAPDNNPGGRKSPTAWLDKNGNLWMYGGFGSNPAGFIPPWLSDMWEYGLATPQPNLSPSGGPSSGAQVISVTDADPAASIYYTTDGSTPSKSSNLYTGPITVNQTASINAFAVAPGMMNSQLTTATYTISSFDMTRSGNVTLQSGSFSGNAATISVTPSGGFSGSVSLSCKVTVTGGGGGAVLPTCSLSPSNLNFSGTGAEESTLAINAGSGTKAMSQPASWISRSGGIVLALLLFVPWRKRRGIRHPIAPILIAIVVLGLGCGSSTGSQGSISSTAPAGSYVVTVSGTSGSITKSVSVALTITN
jgi:hypothetical protein